MDADITKGTSVQSIISDTIAVTWSIAADANSDMATISVTADDGNNAASVGEFVLNIIDRSSSANPVVRKI